MLPPRKCSAEASTKSTASAVALAPGFVVSRSISVPFPPPVTAKRNGADPGGPAPPHPTRMTSGHGAFCRPPLAESQLNVLSPLTWYADAVKVLSLGEMLIVTPGDCLKPVSCSTFEV